jgi:hypothetical protein
VFAFHRFIDRGFETEVRIPADRSESSRFSRNYPDLSLSALDTILLPVRLYNKLDSSTHRWYLSEQACDFCVPSKG